MTPDRRLEAAAAVASLPMYDFPELRGAHDALWAALRVYLAAVGPSELPAALSRGRAGEAAWVDPRLVLTQVCGYPFALRRRGAVQLVATPGYRAPGCQGAWHRSAVLVRQRDRAMVLADVRGRRLALNAADSNTGANLLRAAVAPLTVGGRAFFAGVVKTGAHAASIAAVAEGLADVAAVDGVTWALLQRLRPALCAALRVLGWTPASPGLPLVTGAATPPEALGRLREALDQVAEDPALAAVRRELLLDRFHVVARAAYEPLAELARDAPELAAAT